MMTFPYNESVHETKIKDFFNGKIFQEGISYTVDDVQTVFLCFTNRSGSNYFASHLASTNFLNMANELFNHPPVINYSKEHEIRYFADYCLRIQQKFQKNGFFLIKVGMAQLLYLAKLGLLDTVFKDARYIHIERSDLLAQAISFHIASQTQEWLYTQDSQANNEDVQYDEERLNSIIRGFSNDNRLFNLFFGLNGIQKYHVNYEHFCKNPARISLDVLDWLGVENFPFEQKRLTKKQTNDMKSKWREQFLASDQ